VFSSEQANDLINTQFNTGARFGNIMLRGIEQWIELNMQLAKQQLNSNASTINKLADTPNHASLLALITEQKISAVNNEAIQYPVTVYEIMLKAQTELAKLIGQHFEELNQQAIKIFNTVQSQTNGAAKMVVNGSAESHSRTPAVKTATAVQRKNENRASH
jgi:phasin family protein